MMMMLLLITIMRVLVGAALLAPVTQRGGPSGAIHAGVIGNLSLLPVLPPLPALLRPGFCPRSAPGPGTGGS